MPYYDFDENLKNIVRMMAIGLQDGSVKTVWNPMTGDGRLMVIFGVSPMLTDEINADRLQEAELEQLIDAGLLGIGQGNSYIVKKQRVVDAANSDFEDEIEILLEQPAIDLFCSIVEAARNVPEAKRMKFLVATTFGGTGITHPGFPGGGRDAYEGDIDLLAREGLIMTSYGGHGSIRFDVSPLGFKFYRQIMRKQGQPVQQVEQTVLRFLDTREFGQKYPLAYRKWAEAAQYLSATDVDSKLSTIGHLCREAVQEFATSLVEKYQPPNVDQDKAKTGNRMRAVLELRAPYLGTTEASFLDTTMEYWKAVGQLIQRQEHANQKEGEPLVWEDARRVVFQTAVVMFEIDKSLSRAG
jgi:hypothetical protein